MTVLTAVASLAVLAAGVYLCLLVDTLARGRLPHRRMRTGLTVAISLAYALAILHDVEDSLVHPALVAAAGVFPVVVAFAIAATAGGRRRLTADVKQPALVGSQTFRVIGLSLVVFGLNGSLPTAAAAVTGVADVAIGVLAWWVARLWGQRAEMRVAAVALWNVAGVVVLLFESIALRGVHIFPLEAYLDFVLPVALAFHVLSAAALAQRTRATYMRGA